MTSISIPNWPACPECETDVFVQRSQRNADLFVCCWCDEQFKTAGTS